MTHWKGVVVATRMTMALPVLAFRAAMAEPSAFGACRLELAIDKVKGNGTIEDVNWSNRGRNSRRATRVRITEYRLTAIPLTRYLVFGPKILKSSHPQTLLKATSPKLHLRLNSPNARLC